MSGFALHPEAYNDIDEVRAYVAEDNPDAADRIVDEIFDRIRQFGSISGSGVPSPKPYVVAFAFRYRS
jgi:plasmid stabilization system protein ParE